MKISENMLVSLEYKLYVKNEEGTLELMEEHVTHSNMLTTVLDAHKTLMKLNENNQNMFEPLVKQLQKEQDNMEQASNQQNA